MCSLCRTTQELLPPPARLASSIHVSYLSCTPNPLGPRFDNRGSHHGFSDVIASIRITLLSPQFPHQGLSCTSRKSEGELSLKNRIQGPSHRIREKVRRERNPHCPRTHKSALTRLPRTLVIHFRSVSLLTSHSTTHTASRPSHITQLPHTHIPPHTPPLSLLNSHGHLCVRG